MAEKTLTNQQKDRIHSLLIQKTELDPATGCWVWVGAWNEKHYGVMVVGGRYVRTHRLAAAVWKGFNLDPGVLVYHRCNTRSCCNPHHLAYGNRTESCRFFRTGGPKLWARSLSRLAACEASPGW